jgi:hypothetical protein
MKCQLLQSQYPPIGPQNLEVHPVKKHDPKEMQEILDLFLDQFLFDEPLSYSLKLTREQAIPFFRGFLLTIYFGKIKFFDYFLNLIWKKKFYRKNIKYVTNINFIEKKLLLFFRFRHCCGLQS